MKSTSMLLAIAALAASAGNHSEFISDVWEHSWPDPDEPGQERSAPKGSTPNRYKPHQGRKEMERRAKKMKGQS